MTNLVRNIILTPTSDSFLLDTTVRIIDIDNRNGSAFVIQFSMSPTKPWLVNIETLQQELDAGVIQISVEQQPKFLLRSEDELSEKEKTSRERRWHLIEGLVSDRSPGEILGTRHFGETVSKHADLMRVDRRVIYRLLFRYWSLGGIKNSLLTDSSNIGKSKNRVITKTLGRPPKYLGVIHSDRAIQLRERDFKAINIAYDLYASNKFGTLTKAYNWMLGNFYSAKLPDGKPGDVIRGSHPTQRQMIYHGKKYRDSLYVLEARHGSIKFNKDYRELIGTSNDGLIGPCHRFEIDATIADIYLVHRIHRSWLIGRPVLYVVVDAFTRMIVGIHIGLEGPSWEGARHALYNAFTKKTEFCKRYNIAIREEDWPCHYLPSEISADRAELLSGAAEAMSNTLGVTLKIAPPFRPDWKAIVESRFKLINSQLDLKFIPGGVNARRQERGDRDTELDATLDLDQFTEIVIRAVLNHNKNLRVPHILSPKMIADEVRPTPLDIWNWSQSNSALNAKTKSPDALKISLLPSCEAPIKRGGIQFKKMLYTCSLAKMNNWAAKSHNGRTLYTRVWYDPNSAENVWIRDGGNFQPLELQPQYAIKFKGHRLEEIEDILSTITQISPDEAHERTQDDINLQRQRDEIIKNAKKMKKEQNTTLTKTKFKENIRDKRAAELAVEHTKDNLHLSSIHGTKTNDNTEQEKTQTKAKIRQSTILRLVTENFSKEE
ncbi:Mu transposase C-terminal domain-containing protein [Pseudomonas putida]|uniref:Mu transposase C-terminal domain-containing protein n=1 Tax=Pseudomonas putida TaxID=303 RepID=UPI0015FC3B2C|nr:Mu transposase C-terminal domain-containing protein [Pseudomonas putida]